MTALKSSPKPQKERKIATVSVSTCQWRKDSQQGGIIASTLPDTVSMINTLPEELLESIQQQIKLRQVQLQRLTLLYNVSTERSQTELVLT